MAEILGAPIRNLGLKLEGSPLEMHVQRLYRELGRKGLARFRPACYLTDEWGCPSGEPVIGIPFYLADARLAWLERELNDIEDRREIMMYLRHEAGHAFNYAYRLHRAPEWREMFGSFRRPYRDDYRPIAFSRDYVRHIAGWYAQKHPDEDFAETFAVWLTPGSRWQTKYRTWGALRKLRYMDRVARALRDGNPMRAKGRTDITTDEMEMTVAEFYARGLAAPPSGLAAAAAGEGAKPPAPQAAAAPPCEGAICAAGNDAPGPTGAAAEEQVLAALAARVPRSADRALPPGALTLDADLADIFNVPRRRKQGVRPAADLLRQHRKALTDKVTYWTGVQRPMIKKLVQSMEVRLEELHLAADLARESEHLTELAAYLTAMAMNDLARGRMVRP